MLVILGKTCSGKDAIVKRLCKDYDIKKIVTYTSRPMRKNEVQDVTYHFVSESDFITMAKDGFFAEYKSYDSVEGRWYYGTAKADISSSNEQNVIILTPKGYEDVKKLNLNESLISLYIYANNSTIRQRLYNRGDRKEEAERRILADNQDFKDTMQLADRIIYNNEGANLDDVVKKVYEEYMNLLKNKK